MRLTSLRPSRNSKTSRASRMWPASAVPVTLCAPARVVVEPVPPSHPVGEGGQRQDGGPLPLTPPTAKCKLVHVAEVAPVHGAFAIYRGPGQQLTCGAACSRVFSQLTRYCVRRALRLRTTRVGPCYPSPQGPNRLHLPEPDGRQVIGLHVRTGAIGADGFGCLRRTPPSTFSVAATVESLRGARICP